MKFHAVKVKLGDLLTRRYLVWYKLENSISFLRVGAFYPSQPRPNRLCAPRTLLISCYFPGNKEIWARSWPITFMEPDSTM